MTVPLRFKSVDVCPGCGSKMQTIDSRGGNADIEGVGGQRNRRKQCSDCGERFTTIEVRVDEVLMMERGMRVFRDLRNFLYEWENMG